MYEISANMAKVLSNSSFGGLRIRVLSFRGLSFRGLTIGGVTFRGLSFPNTQPAC